MFNNILINDKKVEAIIYFKNRWILFSKRVRRQHLVKYNILILVFVTRITLIPNDSKTVIFDTLRNKMIHFSSHKIFLNRTRPLKLERPSFIKIHSLTVLL